MKQSTPEQTARILSEIRSPFAMTESLRAILSGDRARILATREHLDPELREMRTLSRTVAELIANPPDGWITPEDLEGVATATAVYADLLSLHIDALMDALAESERGNHAQ